MRPSPRGLAAAVALGAVLLGATARAPAAAPPGESRRVALGAYVPGASWQPSRLDRYARMVGRQPVIVSYYEPWTKKPFARPELEAIWRRGSVPMITWEPWDWNRRRHFPLGAIVAGRYDRYVRGAARVAAAWGHPILLRFAHEMNGGFYPWAAGRPGNTPALYKRAWRHVVGIFRRAGASNVEWVWAPIVEHGGRFPFRRLYPGDRWVDWAGLDGFNRAGRTSWSSFTSIFRSSYDSLTRISRRPLIITETASNQGGGDKAAWVASALRREIPKFAAIRAVVWFTEPFNGVDARVDSSPSALRAFRAAVASCRYSMTRRELLATRPVSAEEAPAPVAPAVGFGAPAPSAPSAPSAPGHDGTPWWAIGAGIAVLVALATAIVVLGGHQGARSGS